LHIEQVICAEKRVLEHNFAQKGMIYAIPIPFFDLKILDQTLYIRFRR
jgi:hypothetical protein